MNPSVRMLLLGALCASIAVWVGVQIAQESYFFAALTAGLSVWVTLSWVRGPRTEAWLLGALVFGYVIGSRGFAQVTPVPGLPLFFGELGLAFALTLLVLRGALRRELPWQQDGLSLLLLFWLALGCGRILWDVRAFGFLALRDFATLYYCLFFFTTVAVCRHAPSRHVLRAALTATFAVLPLTTLLADLFPRFFLSNLLVKGVPLILYKEDLAATYGFVGFLWLLPRREASGRQSWWRWLLALVLLGNGLVGLSRASLLGLLIAAGWLAGAGRWRALRTIGLVCLAGLLVVTAHSVLQSRDFTQTRAYAIYEAATSVVDFSGTRHYQSEFSSDKGDNNRFRLVWWRNVATETLRNSPLLGLGFGADLARGFVAEYSPDAGSAFVARSPHNIFVTMLGRLGLLGVTAMLAIYIAQARITGRIARATRRDPRHEEAMVLQAMCWVVMVSACFGVVLEGPMGAVPFWIILGLAHHEANETSGLAAAPRDAV